jgi:cytochrome c
MKVMLIITSIVITFIFSMSSFSSPTHFIDIDSNTRVEDLLIILGQKPKPHYIKTPDSKLAALGKDIVFKGNILSEMELINKRQSKHFSCTSCHNTQPEFEKLSQSSPEDRLDFAIENQIPFLPASTLYGVVNRTSWYNGDYEKKYGKLVTSARNNLEEAIQLCASECSQGRKLEESEMLAVLHYLWTIDLKINDLKLSNSDLEELNGNTISKGEKINHIKSKYIDHYEATFLTALNVDDRRFGEGGDPLKGSAIYDLSCLHCHKEKKHTMFSLDYSNQTFKYLEKGFFNFEKKSIYQITRFGTSPLPGYRAYMPLYTKEKLSDEQLNDLASFIKQKAQS